MCTVFGSIVAGFSNLLEVGKGVFVCLPIRRCTGEPSVIEHGVLRYSNNARYGSFPSCVAFFIILLTVCTAFSAMPLDCGWCGLEVQWSI